jgi:hypothetical protein
MALATKAPGKWAEHMDKACLCIQREKCIRETGCTTRLKAGGPMSIQTVLNTKAGGFKTYNRGKALRNGPMGHFSLENTGKERRMALASISGLTGRATKGSGRTTR